MKIDVVSLFPAYFKGPFEESIIGRACKEGLVEINQVNIRDFSLDKHKSVDDKPFGGGAGMLLKPEPVVAALRSVKRENSHLVYVTPRGKRLTTKVCKQLAQKEHLIFLAGHYEGIDERALAEVDEEISIGDYVLTNGCLASIVVIDALLRFVPGVLGDESSAESDSFTEGLLEHAHYTRPASFEGQKVPEVLLSGDHAKIASWQRKDSLHKTVAKRADLYLRHLGKGQKNNLVLEVEELRASLRFYKKVLGFTVKKVEEDRAVLITGDNREVVLVEGPSACALHQVVIENKERTQVKERVPEVEEDDEGNLYCRDLDGHIWMMYINSEKIGCTE